MSIGFIGSFRRAGLLVCSAAGLLFTCAAAQAQYRDGYYRPERRGDAIAFVRADLDRAASGMFYLSGGERRRIDHARQEMFEFESKWRQGRFDRHELDDVIGSLQHVTDRNRLEPRDRQILWADLERLREFRANHPYSAYRY